MTVTITPETRITLLPAAARGLALFFGLFSLLNLVAGLRNPGLDLNLWWIDLRPLPGWLSQAFLALAALALLAYAVGLRTRWLRSLTLAIAGLLLLVALRNTVNYYLLLASGSLLSESPVPFSLLVAAALTLIGFASWRNPASQSRRGWALLLGVFLISAALFPAAQVYSFGVTDYRRPADVIVVFGARVTESGALSLALARSRPHRLRPLPPSPRPQTHFLRRSR